MITATLLRTAVAMSSIATLAAAQRPQSEQPKPDASGVEIVEVIGCLGQAPDNTWVLTNGTDPVVSKTIFTTKDALKEAAEKPLGNQRYRLLGVTPFSPLLHKGHKMAVKGALIKAAKGSGVNVTSLQMLAAAAAAACSK